MTYASAGTFTVRGTALVNVLPPNPLLPPNPVAPYRVSAAVGAVATNAATGQRCTVADAKTASLTRSPSGEIQFVPPGPYLFRSFAPSDPCRQLVGVRVGLSLNVTANGVIQSATATVGQTIIDGDTPPPVT